MGRRWGRISGLGRVVGRLPDLIKAITHNGSTNRDQPLQAWPTPLHTGATKACLELLATTLNGAAANDIAILAEFLVLHAPFVLFQVTRFPLQILCQLWIV